MFLSGESVTFMRVLWGTQIKTKERERQLTEIYQLLSGVYHVCLKWNFASLVFVLPCSQGRSGGLKSPCLESQDCRLVAFFDLHALFCLVILFFPFSSFYTSPFSCLLSRMLKKWNKTFFKREQFLYGLRFLKWQVGVMWSKLPYGTGVSCYAIALKNKNP